MQERDILLELELEECGCHVSLSYNFASSFAGDVILRLPASTKPGFVNVTP
jgi:hypothetical protein